MMILPYGSEHMEAVNTLWVTVATLMNALNIHVKVTANTVHIIFSSVQEIVWLW